VSVRIDLNERRADHEPTEGSDTTRVTADELRPRFVVPWRLNADAARPGWEDQGDASCGCGPVD